MKNGKMSGNGDDAGGGGGSTFIVSTASLLGTGLGVGRLLSARVN